jgi:hypothetical protein
VGPQVSTPRRQRRGILIAFCAAVLVAACSSAPNAPPPSPPPPPKGPWTGLLADYRVVWSAEPGIDLLTGPAVVVRAFYESGVGALFGGSADFLYPGFDHAVPREAPPPAPKWPVGEKPYPYPLVGTDRNHILRIETSGTNVTAVFCNWGYGITDDLGDGKFGFHGPPPNPGFEAIFAEWLALTPPPSGATPLPPQHGPAPAPVDDVFGGWRVTQRLAGGPGDTKVPAEWPTMIEDANTCVATAPDPPARRQFLTQGVHPRSDFPTLAPFPGWPAGSAQ